MEVNGIRTCRFPVVQNDDQIGKKVLGRQSATPLKAVLGRQSATPVWHHVTSPMVLLTIGFWFLCTCTVAECKPAPEEGSDGKQAMIRICGRELINVLKGLCKNCFRGTSVQPSLKRTDPFLGIWTDVASRSRRHTGIATECCTSQCSYSYLKSFCLPEEECVGSSG